MSQQKLAASVRISKVIIFRKKLDPEFNNNYHYISFLHL